MIRYFIINNASRASNYGVGTYLKQLLSCLSSLSDVQISMIDMDADTKEYTIKKDESGYTHYVIPRAYGAAKYDIYCRGVFYFLAQQIKIKSGETLIFYFNFYHHYNIATRLKAFFPKSKIVLAIHYFSWCFDLKGNVRKFKNYILREPVSKGNLTNACHYYCGDNNEQSYNSYKGTIEAYNTERKFMQLADSVIALSERTANTIENDYHIGRNKIRVILNGLEEDESLNEKNVVNGNQKNILFVGRLDEIKGVHYLIKAFKRLYKDDQSLHLWLVGDGDFSGHLADAQDVWEAITFTGRTDKTYTEQLYNKAYIGVLPSFHEQCSYTAIEMAMHGIPLVGTDSTGLYEMLKYTPENIVHIDEESFDEDTFVVELSKKIQHLLDDNAYHCQSSQLMRQTYLENYTIDLMRANYIKLIDCLKENRNILSDEMLQNIDYQMFEYINKRPEIDLNFFGMTGVGYYLWRRVSLLGDSNDNRILSHSLMIQEYLIYYLDWMIEEINNLTAKEIEMLDLNKLHSLVLELHKSGFYKVGVRKISNMLGINLSMKHKSVQTKDIFANALKIYNYGA